LPQIEISLGTSTFAVHCAATASMWFMRPLSRWRSRSNWPRAVGIRHNGKSFQASVVPASGKDVTGLPFRRLLHTGRTAQPCVLSSPVEFSAPLK
jgi:hypothetical protein